MKTLRRLYGLTKKNALFLLFALCLILGSLLFVYAFTKTPGRRFFILSPHVVTLDKIEQVNLIYEENDDLIEVPTPLPAKVNSEHQYHFHFKVDKGVDQQYLAVNTHYAFITLKHNEKILYTNTKSKNKNKMNISEAFNLIPIPSQFIGKELTLEIESSLNTKRELEIPAIPIGPKYEILNYYIHSGDTENFWGFVLISSGIILLFSGIFFTKIKDSLLNVLILSFFSIIAGLYILTHTWTIYYYFYDTAFIYFLEYTCLMILTLPICLLFLTMFYNTYDKNWRVKVLELTAIIIVSNMIIQYTLVVSGISQFVQMQTFTFMLLICSSLVLLVLIITADKTKIPSKDYIVLSIFPMYLMLLWAIITYFDNYYVGHIELIILSILIFMVMNFILTIRKYVDEYNKIIESKVYSKLAYTDLLTQIKNRNAFEEEAEKIKKGTKSFQNIYLFMINVNNLQFINNTYGHTEGDLYLEKTGELLRYIEQQFIDTQAYRYDDAEFILITYNKKDKEATRLMKSIENFSKRYKGTHNVKLSLVMGYSSSDQSVKTDFSRLMQTAYKNMHHNKLTQKNKNHIKGRI